MFSGLQICVNPYLCSNEFVRWVRNHRRSRINKKWHKRYGMITRCSGSDRAYRVGDMVVCCPCLGKKIQEESQRHGNIV